MKLKYLIIIVMALVACGRGNAPTESVYSVNGVEFKMIYVEGGEYTMGSDDTVETFPRERPAHRVRVPSFYMAETEVTQELWVAVMGSNPSFNDGGLQLPVEMVSWGDCMAFVARLNEMTGECFALPTEAEWEYAAKGGAKSGGYQYAGSDYPLDVGWILDNSGTRSHRVKEKRPNELGLYDMTGNVWEWCQDWYATDYYKYSPAENPQGPELDPDLPEDSVACHPMRGGGFSSVAKRCRVTNRAGVAPEQADIYYGLRIVRRISR